MRGFNEQELKKLVDSKQVKRPRVESGAQGYELCFDVGAGLRDVSAADAADGTLMTFRGQIKRFRTHRTLIQNMKKLGIAQWRCKLGSGDD